MNNVLYVCRVITMQLLFKRLTAMRNLITTHKVLQTVNYNFANETYSRVRFDINTIITFMGTNTAKQGWHIGGSSDPVNADWAGATQLTKQQRFENYEFAMLEQGSRPFHFTDEQWQQYQHDLKSELHSEKCEDLYFRMHSVYGY